MGGMAEADQGPGWISTATEEAGGPFDPWWLGRLIVKLVWAIAAAWLAWVWGAIAALEDRRKSYCGPEEGRFPDLPCWPTLAEDLAANVERWSWTAVVFVVFTAPVWLPVVLRVRGRRRSASRP